MSGPRGDIGVLVEAPDPLSLVGLRTAMGSVEGMAVVDLPRRASIAVLAVRHVDQATLDRLDHLGSAHGIRVVLIIDDLDEAGMLSAVEHGAVGLLLRSQAGTTELHRAVASARDGDAVMSPALLANLLSAVERRTTQQVHPHGLALGVLGEREVAVLRLLSEGCDTAEVAEHLNYSERTIKSIVAQVVNRLNLRNRTQAVAYAVRVGLI